MTDDNKLEATNRVLRDLERKLSLVLTVSLATSAQSHGSVIRDPQYGGMARESIQLSVINYIRNSGSDFDPDSVYTDRQQRLITKFDREYSPNLGKLASAEDVSNPTKGSKPSSSLASSSLTNNIHSLDDHLNLKSDLPRSSTSSTNDPYDAYYDDNFDSYCESDTENDPEDPDNVLEVDDDMLLPPLPPRLPPREMDPNKLYGLFDFSGPDPLHCTLFREEPVYLVNDLDNYWWLIRKLTKAERIAGNMSNEEIFSDEEDGKVGFVPAECLETHGERLARLNCYKNEVLEKTSVSASPVSTNEKTGNGIDVTMNQNGVYGASTMLTPEEQDQAQEQEQDVEPPLIRRKGSILKKSGSYKRNNKLVKFQNLNAFALDDENGDENDDDSDAEILSYRYYGLSSNNNGKPTAEDLEKHFDSNYSSDPNRHLDNHLDAHLETNSEVLSDVYPTNTPLHISKTPRENVTSHHLMNTGLFSEPRMPPSGDDASIGTYSPDTPPAQRFGSSHAPQEETNELRRSVILDKLSEVTSILSNDHDLQEYKELSFGGSLKDGAGVGSNLLSHGKPIEPLNNRSIANKNDNLDSNLSKSIQKSLSGEFGSRTGFGSLDEHLAGHVTANANIDADVDIDDDDDGSLLDYLDLRQLMIEELSTPLTSSNSLTLSGVSPKLTPLEKKKRSKYEMCLPVLGQLDELSKKLAELEHSLE